MYKTGVYFGRFLPPHRGHLYQMIEASTRCEKLVVVISDNADQTREICRRDGIAEISYRLHFETPEYFTTLFKKRIGTSPSSFRK